MEHIVQFAIGIDDDAIIKRVTECAEKQIIGELKEEIKFEIEHEIFRHDTWFGKENKIVGLQGWVEGFVNDVIEKNKDKIIEMTSEKLADKLSRSKVVKEAIAAKVSNDVLDETLMDDVK